MCHPQLALLMFGGGLALGEQAELQMLYVSQIFSLQYFVIVTIDHDRQIIIILSTAVVFLVELTRDQDFLT